jgi:hypothetical protein
VVATAAVAAAVPPALITALLDRHAAGDWGDLSEDDKAANNEAARSGDGRLFSSYLTPEHGKLWVITDDTRGEGEGPITTVLFPIEAADLIKLSPHPLQQRGAGLGAVVYLQQLPGSGLGFLHPGDQIGRVEGELAVVGVGAALLVDPAVGAELIADLAPEGDFVVEAQRKTLVLVSPSAAARASRRSLT